MTSAAYAELCPGCLTAKGTASICPHCGYDESLKRGPLVLPHRALLHQGQYLIGKVLGKPGGFGITYLALDTRLETRVAIKEYLPRDLAGRDGGHATISAHSAEDGEFFRYGLTQFLQEARTLAKFDHANIVRVRNFFEENGTGYLVMDYYDGITLADYLAQQPQGKLPEKTAIGILMPILDGLREVHAKNFLHRDIKPQNIYLTTGNRPILLDFGTARQAMGERSRSISVVLSEGYAPYEQYHRRGEQGPWTDIYACAAVLYHAVAGEAPPPATERVHKDELDIAALGVSASLGEALRLGLAVDHHKRPQRMTEFQALLLGSGEPSGADEVGPKLRKVNPFSTAKIMAHTPIKLTQIEKVGRSVAFAMLWGLALVVGVIFIAGMGMFTKEEEGNLPTADVTVPVVVETVARKPEEPRVEAEHQVAEVFRREQESKEATAVAKICALLARSINLAFADKDAEAKELEREASGLMMMDAESVSWLHKAAGQGNVEAQFALGYMYTNGIGVTEDNAEAIRWFRKAAGRGNAMSQFLLSIRIITTDSAEAVGWLRKAADHGVAKAQHLLGLIYSEGGGGITKDDAEAIRWWRKAAKQGLAESKTELQKRNLQ